MTQAELAASQHDTRKLYATIRSLCPKQRQATISFRGPHGQALTGIEVQYCFRLRLVRPCQLTSTPFEEADPHTAFAHASPIKAVGPEALPNIFVRALAPELAHWTFHMCLIIVVRLVLSSQVSTTSYWQRRSQTSKPSLWWPDAQPGSLPSV